MQVGHLIADDGRIHVLGARHFAQCPAGPGAPQAHCSCFRIGQIGQAGGMLAGLDQEMPEIDTATRQARGGRWQMRDRPGRRATAVPAPGACGTRNIPLWRRCGPWGNPRIPRSRGPWLTCRAPGRGVTPEIPRHLAVVRTV